MLALLAFAGGAFAAPGDRLDRSSLGPLAFADEFNQARPFTDPLSIWAPESPAGVWKTDFYFGNQRGAYWRPTTRAENFTARTLPGELQVYVDPAYCPGSAVLYQASGHLFMRAYRATPAQTTACGGGSRAFLAPLITTEKSFAQAFGYWEVRGSLPQASGSWAAFWLLPRDRTAANLGRLPEIDVFEHYAGPHRSIRSRPGVPLDRTGRANIAVHTAGGMLQPPVQPVTSTALPHTYGVLWTASELVFYLDDRETWRTPFTGTDPAYLLLNIAVSETVAGDTQLAPYTLQQPAQMVVDWVRVWAPKPAQ